MKLISFSGGCYSGKTTAINYLADELRNKYERQVVVLGEVIRDYLVKNNLNIEDLRKDPQGFWVMQKETTLQRAERELEAVNKYSSTDTIILQDRALTDVLFYLETYTDKANVDAADFAKFRSLLLQTIDLSLGKTDLVVQCKPLNGTNKSVYRTKGIDHLKYFEYDCIARINRDFVPAYKLIEVDFNLTNLSVFARMIANKIL